MEITLSNGTKIKLLAANIDWQRTEGYTGACVSPVSFTDCADAEAIEKKIVETLEAEIVPPAAEITE